MSTSIPKPPEIFDKIVDVVLAHKPQAKAAKKRSKVAKKRSSRIAPSTQPRPQQSDYSNK
jgi:hypothetical protein